MAQLVAHLHGMERVRGSNPLSSTIIEGHSVRGGSFLLKRRCFADVLAEPQKRFKVIETGYKVVKKQDFHDDAENLRQDRIQAEQTDA